MFTKQNLRDIAKAVIEIIYYGIVGAIIAMVYKATAAKKD